MATKSEGAVWDGNDAAEMLHAMLAAPRRAVSVLGGTAPERSDDFDVRVVVRVETSGVGWIAEMTGDRLV